MNNEYIMSKNEVAAQMCKLLSRFADPDAYQLSESKIKPLVHKNTGVICQKNLPLKPNMIGLAFFVTIHKGTPQQDSKRVRIMFDMEKFFKHPIEYVKGTVNHTLMGIDEFKHDEHYSGEFVSALDGSEVLQLIQKEPTAH